MNGNRSCTLIAVICSISVLVRQINALHLRNNLSTPKRWCVYIELSLAWLNGPFENGRFHDAMRLSSNERKKEKDEGAVLLRANNESITLSSQINMKFTIFRNRYKLLNIIACCVVLHENWRFDGKSVRVCVCTNSRVDLPLCYQFHSSFRHI